jgi:hypothetical protein
LVPCIGGEKCSVSIVVPDRDSVDTGEGVPVPFAVDIPVEDAVGLGHEEGVLRPVGHLVADEDLAEKPLLGRLGGLDLVEHGGAVVRGSWDRFPNLSYGPSVLNRRA